LKIEPTSLEGLFVVAPAVFGDERGFFLETYQRQRYSDAGILYDFVQENHSRSVKGVLRGLHFQVKHPQAQIVTILRGCVFDVAVDLRAASKTFGHWFGTKLGDDGGPRQLCMAPGFAHGYYVLSDVADLHYKVSRFYAPEDEGGVLWNDHDIGIEWPPGERKISARDAIFPRLNSLTHEQLPHEL
jgi:dTDP-4-dehydrorhamnose 3,5-epimerase